MGIKLLQREVESIVITNNKRLAKKIRHLTTTAKIPHKWEYIHDEIGFNFRMPNINAALEYSPIRKDKSIFKSKTKNFINIFKSIRKD